MLKKFRIYQIVGGWEHGRFAIRKGGKTVVLGGQTLRNVLDYGKYIQYVLPKYSRAGGLMKTKSYLNTQFQCFTRTGSI